MSSLIQQPYVSDRAPIDASVQSSAPGIGQGDFLYWTGNGVASLTSTANSGSFCGVSALPWPSAYITADQDGKTRLPFHRTGVFAFQGTSGETYTGGQKLYLGANAQTVSHSASGTSIGYVAYDQPATLQREGLVAVVIVPAV